MHIKIALNGYRFSVSIISHVVLYHRFNHSYRDVGYIGVHRRHKDLNNRAKMHINLRGEKKNVLSNLNLYKGYKKHYH